MCGAYFVFLGATALGLAGVVGIIGGMLIWVTGRVALRWPRAAYAVLACGALPFATMTWWSVVTPMIAVLTLAIGGSVIRHAVPARDGAARRH